MDVAPAALDPLVQVPDGRGVPRDPPRDFEHQLARVGGRPAPRRRRPPSMMAAIRSAASSRAAGRWRTRRARCTAAASPPGQSPTGTSSTGSAFRRTASRQNVLDALPQGRMIPDPRRQLAPQGRAHVADRLVARHPVEHDRAELRDAVEESEVARPAQSAHHRGAGVPVGRQQVLDRVVLVPGGEAIEARWPAVRSKVECRGSWCRIRSMS